MNRSKLANLNCYYTHSFCFPVSSTQPQERDYYYYSYYYYYYYYYFICYHLYAGYLQSHTRNKPCFHGTQCCSCSVFTVCATCNVISRVKYVVYFYISTSRSMCAVPSMAVVCSSLISCFPGMLLWYCLSDSEIVPLAPIITCITLSAHSTCYYYYYYY